MKLYKYQADYANSLATFDITNKSRQIGFSSCGIAYKAVKRCYHEDIDQLLVSSSQRQSNKLMTYVEKWLRVYEKLWGMKLKKDNQTEKVFDTGRAIYCMPSKPETIRGFPGDVRLDEFALHPEADRIFEALLPSISSNKKYQISICSTPLGQSNMFYRIFTDEKRFPDFKRTQIDCYSAIKMGCKLNIDVIKRNFDEDSFKQEFECQFIDEATSYFPYELIQRCVARVETLVDGINFMGIDIGRKKDLTCVYVVTFFEDKFYFKHMETWQNMEYAAQLKLLCDSIKKNEIARGYIDSTGLGNNLAEDLANEFDFIEQVWFTTDIKQDLVLRVKTLMEQKRIEIPDEQDLIRDIHAIRKNVTPSNNIVFSADRNETGHADRFWALALAVAAGNEEMEYDRYPVEILTKNVREADRILKGY